ncbi:hypothetical protein L2E82_48222 [Cichorium intybus]|uniref:Uncharacterized protein n=1 Tax=Cichorium intybus TaxID=13427 RepID=A0ACB8YYR4_CICIN|nr:hypothetical protein L2E82_48222 [Cichorium intybus]
MHNRLRSAKLTLHHLQVDVDCRSGDSGLKMSSPLDVSPPTASLSNLVSHFLDPPSNLIQTADFSESLLLLRN